MFCHGVPSVPNTKPTIISVPQMLLEGWQAEGGSQSGEGA